MTIFAFANTKGGVGKSTNALQAAIGLKLAGFNVWLVDGDQQKTCLAAITQRADTGRPMIPASAYDDGPTLRAQVMQQRAAYDHVVIDVGGRDSSAMRAALTVADVALVPFAPRSFDVWALDNMAKLVDEARSVADLKVFAYVNKADSQGSDNKEAAEAVAEYPQFSMLDFRITDRKAYANASGMGLHVEEMAKRNTYACAEMDRLHEFLLSCN